MTGKNILKKVGEILARYKHIVYLWCIQLTITTMTTMTRISTYSVRNRETGEVFEYGLTESEAKRTVKFFEEQDRFDDIFVPDFYQIVEE